RGAGVNGSLKTTRRGRKTLVVARCRGFLPSPLGGEGLGVRGKAPKPLTPTPRPSGEWGVAVALRAGLGRRHVEWQHHPRAVAQHEGDLHVPHPVADADVAHLEMVGPLAGFGLRGQEQTGRGTVVVNHLLDPVQDLGRALDAKEMLATRPAVRAAVID